MERHPGVGSRRMRSLPERQGFRQGGQGAAAPGQSSACFMLSLSSCSGESMEWSVPIRQ